MRTDIREALLIRKDRCQGREVQTLILTWLILHLIVNKKRNFYIENNSSTQVGLTEILLVGDLGAEVGDLGAEVGDLGAEVGDLGAEVGDLGAEVGDVKYNKMISMIQFLEWGP
jgi:hypothetical protein